MALEQASMQIVPKPRKSNAAAPQRYDLLHAFVGSDAGAAALSPSLLPALAVSSTEAQS